MPQTWSVLPGNRRGPCWKPASCRRDLERDPGRKPKTYHGVASRQDNYGLAEEIFANAIQAEHQRGLDGRLKWQYVEERMVASGLRLALVCTNVVSCCWCPTLHHSCLRRHRPLERVLDTITLAHMLRSETQQQPQITSVRGRPQPKSLSGSDSFSTAVRTFAPV